MHNSEPRKAAATMTQARITSPRLRQPIIVRATRSLAPEEMPSTKGPAMGLEKKVCSR